MTNLDLDKTLKSIGKTSFVEDFEVYSNRSLSKFEKVKELVPKYSDNGATIRVSFAEKIFENNLQLEALKNIMNSRVSRETKERALQIIEGI